MKLLRLPLLGSIALGLVLLSGCASPVSKGTIVFPLLKAWYEDRDVYYITTDVSDPEMAHMMGANYAPRLVQAVPNYPKPPGQRTILERVYAFPGGEQANNVFASIPEPLGPFSQDSSYSPIWLMYMVSWVDPALRRELRSENAILDAEEAGLVKIERSNIVANCPIVKLDTGPSLPFTP